MRNQTHLLFAILFGMFYFKQFYIPTTISILLFSTGLLIGYLLPDVDINSRIISLFTKHRGIFHTIWPPAILYLLSYILPLPQIFIGASIGYASHILSDMLTPHGIKPFYPIANLKLRGPIKTGSLLEIILFIALTAYILAS